MWKKRAKLGVTVGGMLSPSDEALIIWIIDNYWNEWCSGTAEKRKLREVKSRDIDSLHYNRPLKTPYFIADSKFNGLRRIFGGTTEEGEDRWNYYYDQVEMLRNDPMFPEFDLMFQSIYRDMYGETRESERENDSNQQGRRVRARNGLQLPPRERAEEHAEAAAILQQVGGQYQA